MLCLHTSPSKGIDAVRSAALPMALLISDSAQRSAVASFTLPRLRPHSCCLSSRQPFRATWPLRQATYHPQTYAGSSW